MTRLGRLVYGGLAVLLAAAISALGAPPRPVTSPHEAAAARAGIKKPATAGGGIALKKPIPPPPVLLSVPNGASITRGGHAVPHLKRGTVLRQGDTVRAGKNAPADLRIGSTAVVRLKPGATLRLVTLFHQSRRNPATSDNRFRLDAGTILIRLRTLTGKSRFLIDTPSAVTAARGTAYLVGVGKAGTELVVLEGRVALSLAAAPDHVLEVGAQQKATARDSLPEKPLPIEDVDRKRLGELKELLLSQDRALEPMVKRLSVLLASRRYAEVEQLGWEIVTRGWSTRNAVRAHAMILEASFRDLGTGQGFGSLYDFTPTVGAWASNFPHPGITDIFRADQAFPDDPIARRWVLFWIAGQVPYSVKLPELSERVRQFLAPVSDPVVEEECYERAGQRTYEAVGDPDATPEMLTKATDWLTRSATAPRADRVTRLRALERLIMLGGIPGRPALDKAMTPDYMANLAMQGRDAWSYYFAGGAYLQLGQPEKAAPPFERFYAAPGVRDSEGHCLVWTYGGADFLGTFFQGQGDAAKELRWRRFFMASFPYAPSAVVERTRKRLQELEAH